MVNMGIFVKVFTKKGCRKTSPDWSGYACCSYAM